MRIVLGEKELLDAVQRLQPNAYGLAIYNGLKARGFLFLSLNRVYTRLESLELAGKLKSHTGDPTSERECRAKKFWEVTVPKAS